MSHAGELFGDDGPVFDPKCPSCGRFYGGGVTYWANGFAEIIKTEATCKRCGPISPSIVCWESDLRP